MASICFGVSGPFSFVDPGVITEVSVIEPICNLVPITRVPTLLMCLNETEFPATVLPVARTRDIASR
jgi:hypothetical protein